MNNFCFKGQHFLLSYGTAVSGIMAPAYADFVMGKLEEKILEPQIFKCISFISIIENILILFI